MVREFEAKDKSIYIQMSKEFYNSEAVDHQIPNKYREVTFEESCNDNPFANGFIIDYNGETAGYGLVSFTFSAEAGGLVVLLEELFIRDKFRNLGLGTEYFSYIQNKYKTSAKRFRLEVTDANKKARALYKRLGYEELEYIQMIKE